MYQSRYQGIRFLRCQPVVSVGNMRSPQEWSGQVPGTLLSLPAFAHVPWPRQRGLSCGRCMTSARRRSGPPWIPPRLRHHPTHYQAPHPPTDPHLHSRLHQHLHRPSPTRPPFDARFLRHPSHSRRSPLESAHWPARELGLLAARLDEIQALFVGAPPGRVPGACLPQLMRWAPVHRREHAASARATSV